MFSHVMVGTNDLARARNFYDALLGQLGVEPGVANKQRYFWRNGTGTFGISVPIDGEPAVAANGGTVGFICQSTQQVDAAHAAGVAAGGKTIEDPPGWRGETMYLAYLRDPDGNKLCLTCYA